MKYKERDKLVVSLREAADFIEDHGVELRLDKIQVYMSAYLRTYSRGVFENRDPKDIKRDLKRVVRTLKPVEKAYSDSTLYVRRKFGESIKLEIPISREVACRRVETGNIIKHAASYIPAREEKEVEWVCTDPLLRAS